MANMSNTVSAWPSNQFDKGRYNDIIIAYLILSPRLSNEKQLMVGDSVVVLRKLMCNRHVATPPKLQLEIARLRCKRVPGSITFVQVQLCLEDDH